MSLNSCFLPCPKGLEPLLVQELGGFGLEEVHPFRAGVQTFLTQQQAYRVCLWSRLASRVLWRLAEGPVAHEQALYEWGRQVPWEEHLQSTSTFAVHATVQRSPLKNSHYAALKLKDALADRFRDRSGARPSVDLEHPDVRIVLHLEEQWGQVYLDLSGESLHRRGYRSQSGEAPLKENLAAAALMLASWPEIARSGGGLLDPCCGVGTLPLEAAMMAAEIAPGMLRPRFGFLGWRQHEAAVWEDLMHEARERRETGLSRLPKIVGYDADPQAIRRALEARERLGLQQQVHFEKRTLGELEAPGWGSGLVIANPPYGERLGTFAQLLPLYVHLGTRLRERFGGWRGAVLTSDPQLARGLGVRADQRPQLYNGALECRLYCFDVHVRSDRSEPAGAPTRASEPQESGVPEPAVQMFVNRLRKNLRKLHSWRQREQITCFRAYDADLPEYNLAVDLYEDWVVVQEYQAPASIDEQKAQARLRAVLSTLPEVLQVSPERMVLKVRGRQRQGFRYTGQKPRHQYHEVGEAGMRFSVNFTDNLDTGLFLDHRLTRRWIREHASGGRFLNLFGYTGAATVAAARGGARESVTVDLSPRFLEWAARNLRLNGISEKRHQLVSGDVREWLRRSRERFDLIFLDPPTFSNSARAAQDFDLQRDHPELLELVMRRLAPEGVLLFTNHSRRFKLEPDLEARFQVENLHPRTIPPDFARTPNIHWAWTLRHPGTPA